MPYTEDFKRRALIRLRQNGGQINKTARELDIGASTLSGWAKQSGDVTGVERAVTKAANEANRARTDERLSQLADLMVEDAHRLRDQLFAATEYFNFNKEGVVTTHLTEEPTFQDKRHIAGAVKMLTNASLDIRQASKGGGEALGLISELVTGLRLRNAGAEE